MEKVDAYEANKVYGPLAGQTIKAIQYAYEQKYSWEKESRIVFYDSPELSDEFKTLMGIVNIEFVVPDNYNRDVVQLLALRKTREEKIKQFQEVLANLDEEISKLEAIGYEAPDDGGYAYGLEEREFELKKAERRGEI